MRTKKTYKEKLNDNVWLGVVVHIDDPLYEGRVKVRIYEKFDQRPTLDNKGTYPTNLLTIDDYLIESNFILPNANLPWIHPKRSNVYGGGKNRSNGSFSTPKIGSLVEVVFPFDDIYSGQYTSVMKMNGKMKDLITKSKGDYVNASVTIFDEDENYWMLYTKSIGMQLFHKDSQIVVRPDSSIFIEHKESSSMIELKGSNIKIISNRDIDITSSNKITVNSEIVHVNGGQTYVGESASYSAVMGEPLMKLLKAMGVVIDGKLSPTPGVVSSAVDAAEAMILSKSVKVSL